MARSSPAPAHATFARSACSRHEACCCRRARDALRGLGLAAFFFFRARLGQSERLCARRRDCPMRTVAQQGPRPTARHLTTSPIGLQVQPEDPA
eukprot:scaffold1484_cov118-Isochrysis_galbana.AAC.3